MLLDYSERTGEKRKGPASVIRLTLGTLDDL